MTAPEQFVDATDIADDIADADRVTATFAEAEPTPGPPPTPGPVEVLTARVAELEKGLVAMSQIVNQWLEDQAVANSLPQIEAALRQQVRANIAQNGWQAAVPQPQA